MKSPREAGVSLFGDAVIENPRDIFDSALLAPFVKRAAPPQAPKEMGRLDFDDSIGCGHVEYLEFEEDFVVVFPRFNFSSDVPIRLADSRWIRMHFRVGGRNTTFFDADERTIEGPMCNLLRLPDGMVATEIHGEGQVNWLTVFCRPAFMLREFGLDRMALPQSLSDAFDDAARNLVLQSASLPAPAWRLLADLDADIGVSPVAIARRQAMVTELICLLLEQLVCAPRPETQLSPREQERIREARDLILRSLHAPPTIAALAHALGTNRTSLTRDFRSYFGRSIYDTIRHERMSAAVRLLQEGESVGEAARRLGYSSTAAFSFAFKQHFGVAPSATTHNR